jgi:3-oxoacyl-[acyl-carrier-protein] synthase-3
MTSPKKSFIRSTGMYVPENIVTNNDLPQELETSDHWIVQRTGIHARRYANSQQRCSDLAQKAVENLLAKGEVEPREIDCIIFATLSPDFFFPGTGVILQEKLGWADRHVPCYDIRQQCTGFVYGLQMAQAFVEAGMFENVLLVCSELHSNALDYSVRGRAVTVLFGDGAAAVVISPAYDTTSGILIVKNHADGRGALNGIHMKIFDIGKKPIINYDPANFDENAGLFPEMPSSKNLFSNAVRRMAEVSHSTLASLGLACTDVDWILPHQANMRINQMVAEHLNVSNDKVLYNIHKYGNTTAATIPLLLAEFTSNGTIGRGDLLLIVAFGSGFTWGAAVVRY